MQSSDAKTTTTNRASSARRINMSSQDNSRHMARKHDEPKRSNIPSDEEILNIIQITIEDTKWHDLHDTIRILANTGIRIRELEELRFADVDFTNARVFISDSYGGHYIPVGPKSLTAIEALCGRHHDDEYILGCSRHDLIRSIFGQFRAIRGRVGAGMITLHSLRTAFCLRLNVSMAPGKPNHAYLKRLKRHLVVKDSRTLEQRLDDDARALARMGPEL